MKILDRYILKNFLHSALLCFVVLMSLRIVGDLFFNLDSFTRKHKDGDNRTAAVVVVDMISYYSIHSLQYFQELSGVIIVASAAFTLAKMNQTNELTAILASGVSLHRVLLPVLLGALAMDALVALDTEVLIPSCKESLARRQDDAGGTDSFRVKLITDYQHSCFYSPRYEPKKKLLRLPMVMLRDDEYAYLGHIAGPEGRFDDALDAWTFASTDKDDAILSIFGAARAPSSEFVPTLMGPDELVGCVMAKPENEDVVWDSKCVERLDAKDDRNKLAISARKMLLKMADGKAVLVEGKPVGTELIEPTFMYKLGPREVEIVAAKAQYGQKDGQQGWTLTDGRIVYRSDLTPRDLALRQSGQWIQYMSTAEMDQLLDLRQTSDPEQVTLNRHARLADFVNNILMLLVGVPFILSRERNLKASAGLTVLFVGALYVFIYLSRYVGIHPPALAAWLPILVWGPIAAVMVDMVKT